MENKEFILDQTTIKKLLITYKLKIPDFQRSFVWKKPKKYQLLESLFKGFPIGAITLYEDQSSYYIIDGLQRINTLKQYLTSPNTVIGFNEFYGKVEADIKIFLEQKDLSVNPAQLKKCIKEWYQGLQDIYEYEKVSILYKVIKNSGNSISEKLDDLQVIEELRDILKSKIEIAHDDIALIIYKGKKDDLPELFKNINTGSVALSQYEILQSVWTGYDLDENKMADTFEAFNHELELIKDDYEINAVKENGKFDIFKNIVGLNHIICCMKNCDRIFQFPAFKKYPKPIEFENESKYFNNDTIGFELYSTIICNSPNQIIKAIDSIFTNQHEQDKINAFIRQINHIILTAIEESIPKIDPDYRIESKYHSIYIIAGIIFSQYKIDAASLEVIKTDVNENILSLCLDLEKHNTEKWFIDDKRQIGFFNAKIKELLEMQN